VLTSGEKSEVLDKEKAQDQSEREKEEEIGEDGKVIYCGDLYSGIQR
jgi:hypothetical protein